VSRTYTEHVAVRVTAKQLRAMRKAAKSSGLELSTWLRVVALAACGSSSLAADVTRAAKAGSK